MAELTIMAEGPSEEWRAENPKKYADASSVTETMKSYYKTFLGPGPKVRDYADVELIRMKLTSPKKELYSTKLKNPKFAKFEDALVRTYSYVLETKARYKGVSDDMSVKGEQPKFQGL